MRIQLTHPVDLTAPGGIDALLAFHHGVFGDARMEDDDDRAAADKAAEEKAASEKAAVDKAAAEAGERAFPDNTPVAEMNDKQAAAYWKHQSRKHENTAKARGDYDDLKKQAGEAATLRKERETENEKAVREAGEKATAEERKKTAPRLVSAEFRAAAKGVLSAEQTTALLEDLDLTKYLTDTGEVDVQRVEKKVAAFAPAKDDDAKKRKFPDLGQGKRASKPAAGVSSGREMYEARRGTKASS